MAVGKVVAGQQCPVCRATVVSERGADVWCPACEWNLAAYETRSGRPRLDWRWVDRRVHALTYRRNARQAARLAGATVTRTGSSAARVTVLAFGAAFLVAVVALLAAGVYVAVATWFTPATVLGFVMILVAVELRPRLGRVDRYADPVPPHTAPALFRLLEEVASAIGAPVPHVVVDDRMNASCRAVGPRQQPVLTLGLPLWGALGAQQRVALLGHELGHLVNGDVRHSPLATMPDRTMRTLMYLSQPSRLRRYRGSMLLAVADFIARVALGVLTAGLRALWLLVMYFTGPDSLRAEYLADQLAAQVAGTTGALELLDVITVLDSVFAQVRIAARRGDGPAGWRAAADRTRLDLAERLPRLRQLSCRDGASLLATHPPDGLRVRVLASRTPTQPQVVLDDEDMARMDAELSTRFERVRRDLANS